MKRFRFLIVAAIALIYFAVSAPKAHSQVAVGIGYEPQCPYGYFDYDPYHCAPYGYYGPEWFVEGVFIGAGPWFHGPMGFSGNVNNNFDPRHGYHGPLPKHGDQPDPNNHLNRIAHFKPNEVRDGQGRKVEAKHGE